MKEYIKREHYILILLNSLYIVPLVIKFTLEGNYEFLAYVGQVIFLLALIMFTIHKTRFPMWLLVFLSIWSALHMAGGSIRVGDDVLYAYKFHHFVTLGDEGLDGYILKYDQVVHFFGFFVSTFVAYWLLLPQLKPNFRVGAIVFVAILAGMGLGAMNEIIEFIAVLLAPETGVGGYYNTAIDLVANGLGALLAGFMILFFKIGTFAFREQS